MTLKHNGCVRSLLQAHASPSTGREINPDSAVAIDKNARCNPSAAVDGFLPLSRHRSAVLRGDVEPHSNDVRERKMTLKFPSRTPSLLQDSTSLPATAESGIISAGAKDQKLCLSPFGHAVRSARRVLNCVNLELLTQLSNML